MAARTLAGGRSPSTRRDQRRVGVLRPLEGPVRHPSRGTSSRNTASSSSPCPRPPSSTSFAARVAARHARRGRDHHRPGPRGRRRPRCHPPGGAVRRHVGHQRQPFPPSASIRSTGHGWPPAASWTWVTRRSTTCRGRKVGSMPRPTPRVGGELHARKRRIPRALRGDWSPAQVHGEVLAADPGRHHDPSSPTTR